MKTILRLANAKWLTAIYIGVFVVWGAATPTFAQKPFLAAVKNKFNLPDANAKCTLCHVPNKRASKQNLNDFGKAIQSDADMKPILNKERYTKEDLDILLKVVEKLGD